MGPSKILLTGLRLPDDILKSPERLEEVVALFTRYSVVLRDWAPPVVTRKPETRRRIENQSGAERANGRRLSNLVANGDDLVTHVDDWGSSLGFVWIAGNLGGAWNYPLGNLVGPVYVNGQLVII